MKEMHLKIELALIYENSLQKIFLQKFLETI